MAKIIFVTGGVVSSLGKGIVAASLGNILQNEGFSVKIKKLDPYLNIDPGTMNPTQHGEVFVTNDGGETDLDLGHYERFTGKCSSRHDNVTSGRIYQRLLEKERRGEYLGKTVQVVPHVTDLIKEFIMQDVEKYDFTICEIGGTVGDIEQQAFLEAIRQTRYDFGRQNTMSLHVTLLPYINASDEIKTKPTQNSVKDLMSYGIAADVLVCRTSRPLEEGDKKKLSAFCNVDLKNVIEAPDVKNIYEIPIIYAQNGLGRCVLQYFNLQQNKELFEKNLTPWANFVKSANEAKEVRKIAIVGKYISSKDSYKSLIESIYHACIHQNIKPEIHLVDAKDIMSIKEAENKLAGFHCAVIAGGFGTDGILGKIHCITYLRENNIPMLGICLGMQLSVIEFARNVAGLNVTSSEFNDLFSNFNDAKYIVDIMQNWKTDTGDDIVRTKDADLGGTMRLGSYISHILPNTLAHQVYQKDEIRERHRHRYEVDIKYREKLAEFGGVFSSLSPDGKLPEIFEIHKFRDKNGKENELKFFITVQFHPEFNSNPLSPNPIFVSLIKACI
ncbi:CTP synthase [Candidatus Deianiraea vastatrix]|uniref:CTP synthase (glutamine hydrolyzing) n=1 Tax=Candidatus Deianiraea vastatrix TaxID=2163644 RepID=A0A5B8XIS2_9RICK|nr:CTP synthase [Candidatus Deianiraea vastatrix]QED23871.1 CTP synthase [Candidatus Deianiraea vastatrix]